MARLSYQAAGDKNCHCSFNSLCDPLFDIAYCTYCVSVIGNYICWR